MGLVPGTRLGPYEIGSALGAGGMGEVYRARDTRLDRTVAIKILAPQLAVDPQFRERFDREARSISQLTHAHICTLYDVGRTTGERLDAPATHFLVMEYLEGEALAARLARGRLPLPEALRIASEIARALDHAHRHGIVHRDLKPGNVMLTKSGTKLLDFGLAKGHPSGAVASVMATAALTVPGPQTAQGTILGTVQYMAPEQLEGRDADARSDIWAFGCVLYGMVTGRHPFESRSEASLVAAILEHEPAPVSSMTTVAPAALDHLIARCLAKDPEERWASAHDVLLELKWIGERDATAARVAVPPRARSRERTLSVLLAIASLAAISMTALSLRERPAPPVHGVFETRLPPDLSLVWTRLSLSPDGKWVAFRAEQGGRHRLFLRPLRSSQVIPLEGTEDAGVPFWSPDSSAIAFFTPQKLKRIALPGAPPVDVCDAPEGQPGSWNAGGTIIFGSGGAIHRVPAGGGTPERITDAAGYAAPEFLADGRRFLARRRGGLYAGALDQPTMTKVLDGVAPFVLAAGHMLFPGGSSLGGGGPLLAQPFDQEALKLTGTAVSIADDLRGAMFSAAGGVLVYSGGGRAPNRLRWLARNGAPLGDAGEPAAYFQIAVSPGGTRVALSMAGDLWILDLATNVLSRLTSDPGSETDPAWSPDERRIAFTAFRSGGGAARVFEKDLVTGAEQQLAALPSRHAVVDEWSPDGRTVIFRNMGPLVYAVSIDGERTPRLLAETQGADSVRVSPDLQWVAFTDSASGRAEVSVARFPGFTDKRQVSRAGGMQPIWRRDGKELFYLGGDARIYAVPIQGERSLTVGAPVPLFETRIRPDSNFDQYGVVQNGERFLVLEPEQPGDSLTFVLDWPSRLRAQ